jgi:hypothetical protein
MPNWKIHIASYPGHPPIFDQFEARFMALNGPKEFAMFERTSDDMAKHAYLLTPAAGAACPRLGGVVWSDATPEHLAMEGWGLGIGHADAKAWFKLP